MRQTGAPSLDDASGRPGLISRKPAVGTGTGGYYYFDERRRDDNGIPLERWGRESQALRFASEEDARRVTAGFQLSPAVKFYEVVRLPVRRR